ncbi:hypothetical protein JXQ70_03515 [bacterium]|nr:hypothetical protein [bacterium]
MKNKDCHIFQQWLERMPRTELSPAFKRHLEQCPDCAHSYGELAPLVEHLTQAARLDPLSAGDIAALSGRVIGSYERRRDRWIMSRLALVGLACLPLLIVINGLWGYVGYSLFQTYVSPLSARIYLVLFLMISTFISSLSYGLLPIMAGWRSRPVPKESSV